MEGLSVGRSLSAGASQGGPWPLLSTWPQCYNGPSTGPFSGLMTQRNIRADSQPRQAPHEDLVAGASASKRAHHPRFTKNLIGADRPVVHHAEGDSRKLPVESERPRRAGAARLDLPPPAV